MQIQASRRKIQIQRAASLHDSRAPVQGYSSRRESKLRNQPICSIHWVPLQGGVVMPLVNKPPDNKSRRSSNDDVRNPVALRAESRRRDNTRERIRRNGHGDVIPVLV